MSSHKKFIFSQLLLTLLLTLSQLSPLFQNGCQAASPAKNPPAALHPITAERIVREFKALPKQQVNKNRAKAGLKLQANIAKALTVLSNEQGVPKNVRMQSRAILKSIKSGRLASPMTRAIPNLISNFPSQYQPNNNPGGQLDSVLQTVRPNSPNAVKSPIDGVVTFLKTNLVGVNRMLGRLVGPSPDLFDGVVQSLLGGLDAVTVGVAGSLDSLGPALGGALGGVSGGGLPLGNVLG